MLTARIRNPNVDADERRFIRWTDRNPSRPNAPGMRTHCWIWVGARTRHKQPMFRVGGKYGKTVRPARWYWEKKRGPIPDGMQLSRRCGRSMCVRLDHGELRPQGSHVRLYLSD